jgi:hypothetical protein
MIAYIYRPKRQRNGKQVFNRIWRARLKLNGDAKARDISLNCADKQTAEQKLRDSIRDYERTAVGLMAPAAQRETFENPMERLVDGYVADLKALGRSTDHVRHVDTRLRRLMRECKWQNLREATADSFLRWRTEQKKSPKTINEYQAALSALFSWLRKQNRVAANPFELVSKVDARGKESFHRRALNDDEARRLAGQRKSLICSRCTLDCVVVKSMRCAGVICIWTRPIRFMSFQWQKARAARNNRVRCILNW